MGKGEETRTAILDASLQVASTVGFNALSIGQLADHTGMSKSGLFAHFRSKEQLQLQTFDHARQVFVDTVVRPALLAGRGEPRVRALLESWLRWADGALEGGCIFVTASVEFDDQPGAMRDALLRNQRDWHDLIARVAADAVAEGDFRDDLDTELFAFQANALMLGYNHANRLLHDPRAGDHIHAAFETLLDEARTA